MSASPLQPIVVGAGIGGLTAALCLANQGFSVNLLEQAPRPLEFGAGIQLSPNATRVLFKLGLEAQLRSVAFEPEATNIRHWRTGRLISAAAQKGECETRYGAPYLHVHRGDLLQVLVDAVQASSQIELTLGERVEQLTQDGDDVLLKTSQTEKQSGLVIGADGIHSTVRQWLWGDSAATFTGNVAWRMLVPAAHLRANLIPPMTAVWWGPGKHFVHYYVRGGDLVNCVCVVEKENWEPESWTESGEQEELLRDFAGWHPCIRELIEQAPADEMFKWGLFDRPPMGQWSRGSVTLLGDACHPTLPFLAQGAAMAIEDAAVLALCLKKAQVDREVGKGTPAIDTALNDYEDLRRGRTARVQRDSRRNARVFHLSGVPAWLRNQITSVASARTLDRLYRYDAFDVVP